MPTSIKTICGFKDATISQNSDSTLPILAEGPSDLGHKENEHVMWICSSTCSAILRCYGHSGPTNKKSVQAVRELLVAQWPTRCCFSSSPKMILHWDHDSKSRDIAETLETNQPAIILIHFGFDQIQTFGYPNFSIAKPPKSHLENHVGTDRRREAVACSPKRC